MIESADTRASDQERDQVVELLHGHLLAGRLEIDEHEERVAEAYRAKYRRDLAHALRELPRPARAAHAPAPVPPTFVRRPGGAGRPGAALALGLTGTGLLMFSFGTASPLALPLSVLAWVIGARAARRPTEVIGLTGRNTALTGMWLGIAGTLISLLAISVLAVIFGLLS